MKHNRWMIPVILALLIATTVLSAMAYFNSAKTTTGTIHSGTLELLLSKDGVNYGANVGTPWDLSNAKPGDTVAGKLYMYNNGSIDSTQVTFEWGNILNSAMADHIFLTHVWDSKNTVDAISGVIGVADVSPADGKVSLNELAALSGRYTLPYDAVSDVEPFLPAGSTQWLYMEFVFDPAAGNEFQGNTMTYDLTITAEQVHVFP